MLGVPGVGVGAGQGAVQYGLGDDRDLETEPGRLGGQVDCHRGGAAGEREPYCGQLTPSTLGQKTVSLSLCRKSGLKYLTIYWLIEFPIRFCCLY